MTENQERTIFMVAPFIVYFIYHHNFWGVFYSILWILACYPFGSQNDK